MDETSTLKFALIITKGDGTRQEFTGRAVTYDELTHVDLSQAAIERAEAYLSALLGASFFIRTAAD